MSSPSLGVINAQGNSQNKFFKTTILLVSFTRSSVIHLKYTWSNDFYF